MKKILFAMCLISSFVFADSFDDVKLVITGNARFNFTILIPEDAKLDPAPANGDGQSMTYNGVYLVYFGYYSAAYVDSKTPLKDNYLDAIKSLKQDKTVITYKTINLKKGFFVVSGIQQDGKVYYTKTILDTKGDVFSNFVATYDYNNPDKMKIDNLVAKIAQSLTAGSSGDW